MVHHGYEAFDPTEEQRRQDDVPYGIQSASEWAWDDCGARKGGKGKSSANGRSVDKGSRRRDSAAARTAQSGGCFDSRPLQRGGCAGVQRSAQSAPQQIAVYEEDGVYIVEGATPPVVYEQQPIPGPVVVPQEYGRQIEIPASPPQVYIDDDLGAPPTVYVQPGYEALPPGPAPLPRNFDAGPPSGPGLLQYEFPPPGPGLLQGYFNRYEGPPSGPGLLQGYFNPGGDAPRSGPGLLQGYGSDLEYE